MTDITNERKIEHIEIIRSDKDVDRRKYYFDEISLVHRALPELNLSAVDPSVGFLGKQLSFPLLISSMTGGDHDVISKINRNMAIAAEATGVAMGVGSQRVMFTNPAATSSFEIRNDAPNTVLLANLGAVQLNCGFDLEKCQSAVDTLQADGLCLHLNPLQEAVQPEGDVDFSGLSDKIGYIAEHLGRPVIVKEIGCGISAVDAELLVSRGIKYIDVAGSGGTSWSRIEHYRQASGDSPESAGIAFQDWGIPTPVALESMRPYLKKITVIGSGGIRNGIDMVKAVILGATVCGLASPFLEPAKKSPEDVIRLIRKLRHEFIMAMFLLGIKDFESLHNNSSLVLNNNFKNQRH